MSNLIKKWKALWDPDRYHGWGKNSNYFEGWYFKIVTGDESLAMALIPGISMDDEGRSHAFIQMIDGSRGETFYDRFAPDEFTPNPDVFELNIGDNYFSGEKLVVDLPCIQGEVEFKEAVKWPVKILSPGVMGWYSFVPMMQCYHGVVSMHHRLDGYLEYNHKGFNFQNGLGYIEKDWGSSFPKCWIWMQSNHFDQLDRKVSFMASLAHIPWLGRYFVGFLSAIYLDDELIQFTTYNNARMTSSLDESHVYLTFRRRDYRLEIIATKGSTGALISPIKGGMTGKVSESLTASIEVRLYRGGALIYEGTGRNAGLEVAGDVEILLTDQ